ncbi:MAG: hypothetical protein Q9220_003855 [cf. Caloplaca sp. 1 TL-2023]
MLSHYVPFLAALVKLSVAFLDLNVHLTCEGGSSITGATSALLTPTSTSWPTPHGSMGQGSAQLSATRCPRAKPTVTVTSTSISATEVTISQNVNLTPILAEPTYTTTQPIASGSSILVSISGDQVVTSGYTLPQSLSCGPENPPATSTLATPSTCPSLSTATATTTTTVPSSIVYEGCGGDNFISDSLVPGPGPESFAELTSLTLYNVTAYTNFTDVSFAQCCGACQELTCAFGSWRASPFTSCDLYFQNFCDGAEWVGSTFNYGGNTFGDGFVVFNGPCGQIAPGGPSP